MANQKQFCTFYLDNLLFGIDVLRVQEIILPQKMTKIPTAPPAIRGLINLRGQVVTALDLRTWFGFQPLDSGEESMNVVIYTSDDTISFLVDSIGDVIETDGSTFEPPLETIEDSIREMLVGVYKLEHKLLLVMDTERAFEIFLDKFQNRHSVPAN